MTDGGTPDLAFRALADVAGGELSRTDWSTLLRAAERERLQGVLWRAVEAGVVTADDLQRAEARDALRAGVWHTVRLFAVLVHVQARLLQRGINTIVLKGPAAAALDTSHLLDRMYVDLDILVPSADLDLAVALLVEDGATRTVPEVRTGFDRRFAKTVTVRTPEGFEIDVHRTLTPEPFGVFIPETALHTDLHAFQIGRHTFQALSPLNRFMQACYHAVLGGDDMRIVPLLDAMHLLARLDASEVIQRSMDWRAGMVVARATRDMGRRLDLPTYHPLREWAVAYEPTRFERLAMRHTVDRYARQSVRTLLTLPYMRGWADRRDYLLWTLWPSEEFLQDRGTDRRAWLQRGQRAVLPPRDARRVR